MRQSQQICKYNYISFNESSTITVSYDKDDFISPELEVDYVLIGGGGGGGAQDERGPSGGGGGGAFVIGSTKLGVGEHQVVVGAGGSEGEMEKEQVSILTLLMVVELVEYTETRGSPPPDASTFGSNYFENVGSHGGAGADSDLDTTGDYDYGLLNTYLNNGGVSESLLSGGGGGGGAGSHDLVLLLKAQERWKRR